MTTAGRAPAAPDEVALGRRTARRLDRGIGDSVTISGPAGNTVDATVVGISVTPEQAGDGAAMTFAGFAALSPGRDEEPAARQLERRRDLGRHRAHHRHRDDASRHHDDTDERHLARPRHRRAVPPRDPADPADLGDADAEPRRDGPRADARAGGDARPRRGSATAPLARPLAVGHDRTARARDRRAARHAARRACVQPRRRQRRGRVVAAALGSGARGHRTRRARSRRTSSRSGRHVALGGHPPTRCAAPETCAQVAIRSRAEPPRHSTTRIVASSWRTSRWCSSTACTARRTVSGGGC